MSSLRETWRRTNHGGRRYETVHTYTDKTASERDLMRRQLDADRRASGCRTVEMDHAGRPVAEHVEAYLEALRLETLDAQTLRIARWTMDRLVEWGGWERLADVTAESVRRVLDRLDREGRTASYQNKFVQRAKAFVQWLQREERLAGDPLLGLKRVDEHNGKQSRARRALDDNEALALLDAAPASRRLKYALPLLAGIRRSEFRRLLSGDLWMNAPRPFIQLRPQLTKHKKADALPLHPCLVKLLAELEPGPADRPVVSSVPDMKTVAKDLLAAGVATEAAEPGPGRVSVGGGRHINIADRQGRRADFHALRHTDSTNLDRTGCSWVTKKALMRHAFAGVTEGYSHARLEELYAAIERLPSPPLPEAPAAAEGVRTGTDAGAVAVDCAPPAHQTVVGQGRGWAGIDAVGAAADAVVEVLDGQAFAAAAGSDGGHWRALAGIDLIPVGSGDIVSGTGPSTQVEYEEPRRSPSNSHVSRSPDQQQDQSPVHPDAASPTLLALMDLLPRLAGPQLEELFAHARRMLADG